MPAKLTAIHMQALQAAVPFGGHARDDHKHVIRELKKLGLVETHGTHSDGSGLSYSLTDKGKAVLKKKKTTASSGGRTEETALFRNRALVRSGSRRVADGMAMIIGAKNLRWRMSKHGYHADLMVKGFKRKKGENLRVTRKIPITIVSRKEHQHRNDMAIERHARESRAPEVKGLPYGFEISFQNGKNRLDVFALTNDYSKTPDKLIFAIATHLQKFLAKMAEDFLNIGTVLKEMYERGELDDLDHYFDTYGGKIISARGVRLVRDKQNFGGGSGEYHIEFDMGKRGQVSKAGPSKIFLANVKNKAPVMTYRTSTANNASIVYEAYEFCADMASKMESIVTNIERGFTNRSQITKIITQGAKYAAVIRVPGMKTGSIPATLPHGTSDAIRQAIRRVAK